MYQRVVDDLSYHNQQFVCELTLFITQRCVKDLDHQLLGLCQLQRADGVPEQPAV